MESSDRTIPIDVEELVRAVRAKYGRDVSISFSPEEPPNAACLWVVMVEGDRGGYGGLTLVEALQNRLSGSPPEGTEGWGSDAR